MLLTRLLGHKAAWVLALFPAAIVLHFTRFWPEVAKGEVVTGGYAWIPSFNVSFSWLIDGLSLTFALLIAGIGTLLTPVIGMVSGAAVLGEPFGWREILAVVLIGSALALVLIVPALRPRAAAASAE